MKENGLSNKLGISDHFEQAGILTYWLCRYPPVSRYEWGHLEMFTDSSTGEVLCKLMAREKGETEAEKSEFEELKHEHFSRYLIFNYNETYCAFQIGLQICNFFENYQKEKQSREYNVNNFSDDWSQRICHLLRYQNISPGIITMLYDSIYN